VINEDIPGDLDVICLQEVFNEDAWNILNEKLRSKYPYILFDAHRVRVSSLKFTMVNSGLYIASKYPIVQSMFYPFKNSYSEDALSGKGNYSMSLISIFSGVLCAEIQIAEKSSIIVATTHMQAPTSSFVKSSATRVEQYKEMEDCMSEFGDTAELDVQAEILCGDFNTDPRSPIDDACLKRYKNLVISYSHYFKPNFRGLPRSSGSLRAWIVPQSRLYSPRAGANAFRPQVSAARSRPEIRMVELESEQRNRSCGIARKWLHQIRLHSCSPSHS